MFLRIYFLSHAAVSFGAIKLHHTLAQLLKKNPYVGAGNFINRVTIGVCIIKIHMLYKGANRKIFTNKKSCAECQVGIAMALTCQAVIMFDAC